jgi:hypothetical protein
MHNQIARRTCIVGVALVCAGCASLPSVDSVEGSFRRQHPAFVIVHVTSRVDVSEENHLHDGKAVFQVLYREPDDPKLFTYERRFRNVPEGWIELPSSTSESPQ